MKNALRISALGLLGFGFIVRDLLQEGRQSSRRPLTARTSTAAPSPVPPHWWSQAQGQLKSEERRATLQTRDDRGEPFDTARWHMVNREAGLRAYAHAGGIEFRPREGERWRVAMLMEGGSPGSVHAEGPEIAIERGIVEERLENRDEGFEHSFVVREGPPGPFTIWMRVESEGIMGAMAKGSAIVFQRESGVAMEYRDLKVLDATDRCLASRMVWESGRIGLHVLEAGAYPIRVDPLASAYSWFQAGDQTDCSFGSSVATAGDVNNDGFSDIIVSAPRYDAGQTDEGKVFVFHGSPAGLSTTPNWTAEGNLAGALFGWCVSTAGNVNGDGYSDIVIGAPRYDSGQVGEGMVFVYHGGPGGLPMTPAPSGPSPAPSWSAEGNQTFAAFGHSVSTAGDVNGDGVSDLLIGAPSYDNGQYNEGAVFVYLGSADGLPGTPAASGPSPAPSWSAESNREDAYFGNAVSTAGDVNGDGYGDVLAAAYRYSDPEWSEGIVCLYLGSSTGLPTSPGSGFSPVPDWTLVGNQEAAEFGAAVSTAGDINGDGYSDILIGAPQAHSGETMGEGLAFVFLGGAAGPSAAADYLLEMNQENANFGSCVSTAGDLNGDGYADFVVGAPLYDGDASLVDSGAVFVYYGGVSLSEPDARILPPQPWAWYRLSVSLAGDIDGDGLSDIIVGVPNYTAAQPGAGAAFILKGSGDGLSTSIAWSPDPASLSRASTDYGFGTSVSTAGDVNGDGYSDVIVGAPYFDNGQLDEGRVFVWEGGPNGLSPKVSWVFESNVPGARFGMSVATAGDVNGDGFSDIVVGAPFYDGPGKGLGAVYVYFGSSFGPSDLGRWVAIAAQESRLGLSVATAGDVNGDGFSDIIVGAPYHTGTFSREGQASVYHGGPDGLSETPNWSGTGGQAEARFGSAVSTAGDVNRDGFSDVVVGAPREDSIVPAFVDAGAIHVYHGSPAGLSGTADSRFVQQATRAYHGGAVSTAGDVNGDGYSDIIVGAPGMTSTADRQGMVSVYYGRPTGLWGTPWTAYGTVKASFGFSVSTAGDVDGDGYSDIIVGSPGLPNSDGRGMAVVYLGSPSGPIAFSNWARVGSQEGEFLGNAVSTAGDVNGDGYSDVIVAAAGYDVGSRVDLGRVAVYHGNGGGGPTVLPRQFRGFSRSPMQLLGSSGIPAVDLGLFARAPSGRARARLEARVTALGVPYTESPRFAGDWTDLPLAGADLGLTVISLLRGTAYRWRMRLQYYPHMNYGPWFSIGPNGANEADFRTPP